MANTEMEKPIRIPSTVIILLMCESACNVYASSLENKNTHTPNTIENPNVNNNFQRLII